MTLVELPADPTIGLLLSWAYWKRRRLIATPLLSFQKIIKIKRSCRMRVPRRLWFWNFHWHIYGAVGIKIQDCKPTVWWHWDVLGNMDMFSARRRTVSWFWRKWGTVNSSRSSSQVLLLDKSFSSGRTIRWCGIWWIDSSAGGSRFLLSDTRFDS